MRSPSSRAATPSCALVFALVCALAGALISAPLARPAAAQEVRLLVQSSPLAGYQHHAASRVFTELRVGDRLELVREPDNPHDANAIRVEWRGHKLGYVPRADNAALAWAMDRGAPVGARISALRDHANPRLRIELEVFLE